MSFFFTQLVLATPVAAAYALFALGIVLIYRASRVLNLAHGVMAMLPAYAVLELRDRGVPVVVAVLVGVAVGAALGIVVERVFVRRLRSVSATAQTVGTVAVYGLVIAAVSRFIGSSPRNSPVLFGEGRLGFGDVQFRVDQIGLIVVAVALTVTLFALFKFTALGLAMRGSASNRTAAALVGVDPDRTTAVAWALGGALAAVAGIMLAALSSLDPFNFPLRALPGFVAALIGGLGSMPGALVGALVVGLATGGVPGLAVMPMLEGFASSIGAAQAVLALVAFVVMARRGERLSAGDVRSAALT